MRVCLYLVPGPVGSVSSIMDTTWAVISWSVPSYIPQDYPIITYEIGYHILQSGNCSMTDGDDINIQMLQLSNSTSDDILTTRITGLNDMSCYIFGVRAYSNRGSGGWFFIANETIPRPPSPTIVTSPPPTTGSSSIGLNLIL